MADSLKTKSAPINSSSCLWSRCCQCLHLLPSIQLSDILKPVISYWDMVIPQFEVLVCCKVHAHPSILCNTTAWTDSNGLLVFGGESQTDSGARRRSNDVVRCQFTSQESRSSMDYETWSMDVKGSPPSPRSYHTATRIGQRMVVFGGRSRPGNAFNDVFILDLSTSTWEECHPCGDAPSPRWKHVAVEGWTHMCH